MNLRFRENDLMLFTGNAVEMDKVTNEQNKKSLKVGLRIRVQKINRVLDKAEDGKRLVIAVEEATCLVYDEIKNY